MDGQTFAWRVVWFGAVSVVVTVAILVLAALDPAPTDAPGGTPSTTDVLASLADEFRERHPDW